jgi:hypothetical protein
MHIRLRIFADMGCLLLVLSACQAGGRDSLRSTTTSTFQPEPTPSSTRTTQPTPGRTYMMDYPRLITYTPWGQPMENIARFDAVMGAWPYPGAIAELRKLKPEIPVFGYFNPIEVGFNPSAGAGANENRYIQSLPAEWFLTQAGSTLAEAVDATSTELNVVEVTRQANGKTYELFVAGDALLIDGESVLVKEVDSANKRLTVQRGYGRPASAHPIGTRIAAHISIWPNQWVFNISTLCPSAVAESSAGAEQLSDYNARKAAEIVRQEGWDGLFLDATNPGAERFTNYANVRSVDLDRSNHIVANYDEYDKAWNDGLRRFESQLRSAIGPEKILYANWGMANFDLLNGYHYEAFPWGNGSAFGGQPWETIVSGPVRDGSYFDWMKNAVTPRLTVIQTFENDGAPNATSDLPALDKTVDCKDPAFKPNYRKMRFGLTTTLLGDGFFSYEYSTYASSWKCLFWFDEYDNAGAQKGYLGQPLGPAYHPLPALSTANLFGDGTFEESLGHWNWWGFADQGYQLDVSRDTTTAVEGQASMKANLSKSGGQPYFGSLSFSPVDIAMQVPYSFSFWAKADRTLSAEAVMQKETDPWTEYFSFGRIDLTTEWQHYHISGSSNHDDPISSFVIRMGSHVGTIWFDGMALQQGSDQVWRRDFEGGTVLVNATLEPQTVALGAVFRKINGIQDPNINDGAVVTEVTLPPLDGIILLRIDPSDG